MLRGRRRQTARDDNRGNARSDLRRNIQRERPPTTEKYEIIDNYKYYDGVIYKQNKIIKIVHFN